MHRHIPWRPFDGHRVIFVLNEMQIENEEEQEHQSGQMRFQINKSLVILAFAKKTDLI